MVEHVRTSPVSLLWQNTELTPILGFTPQPCFRCQLNNESRSAKQRLCFEEELRPRVDRRFSSLKSALGVEHQLKDKWTLWREDSVLTMQSQGDYTVAHMPRPQKASSH